ncbi:MAG: hypothetical protein O3C43_21495 [Verrucomicrobia bacterium]|nr:hypothetical protein [Verrucomicrobiota bacterium]
MNTTTRFILRFLELRLFIIGILLFSLDLHAQQPGPVTMDKDDDIFELSLFTVEASNDSGYQATSTLAGTRLKTEIRDLGASISVLTENFFEDIGATDGNTALAYVLNMEVGGSQGNFAGGDYANTRPDQDEQRANPQSGQRVRGLSAASLTRNYFLTDIPFDTYNTSAVTILRGPNSLLFGIGSPAGVIDNSLVRASVSGDTNEVGVRFGERESYRLTMDFNKVLVKDRFAVRIAGLNNKTHYKQQPAEELDHRIFLAFEWVVAKNEGSSILGATYLRGNYEEGEIKATPPNVIPPTDGISPWFSTPDSVLQQYTTFPNWAVNGSFVPKFTVDTRPGLPQINGSVANPFNWQLALHYTDPNNGANVGFPGSNLAGGQGRIVYSPKVDGRKRFDLYSTIDLIAKNAVPSFTVPVIMDRQVFDNENRLISGSTNKVDQDFDAYNLTLEQGLFGGRAGIELAYDKQEHFRHIELPFSSGQTSGANGVGDISIDVNEYLGNDMPNPNLGRPMMKTRNNTSNILSEREAGQATAYYILDPLDLNEKLGWLGRHVFTGFFGDQTIDQLSKSFSPGWESDTIDVATVLNALPTQGRNTILNMAYVGPSLLDSSIQSFDDVRITDVINVPMPQAGDTYNLFYFDPVDRQRKEGDFRVGRFLGGGNITRQTIESRALSWQSHLLSGHLVGLLGWRTDETETFERIGNANLPTGPYDPANLQLTPDPTFMAEGDTFTWSAVGHVPSSWLEGLPLQPGFSVHYNSSENFSAAAVRRDLNGKELEPPNGRTEEYGFTLGLFDGKFLTRLNWFETSSSGIGTDVSGAAGNAFSSAPNQVMAYLNRWQANEDAGLTVAEALAFTDPSKVGLFDSYAEIYEALINLLPPEQQALRNIRFENGQWESDPNLGQTETTSFVAKGFEIDLTGNLTPSWRVALNVGKQETVQSDTARVLTVLANTIRDNLISSGLGSLADSAERGEPSTSLERFNTNVMVRLTSELARDNTVSLEQRKWRANALTNYDFQEGFLKGAGIGGAFRWQDKVATGYPLLSADENGIRLPDLNNAFFGPTEFNGDLWISYSRDLNRKIRWKVQLNARNLLGRGGYVPVITNPDGKVAVVRNPNPTEVFLSNTFKF